MGAYSRTSDLQPGILAFYLLGLLGIECDLFSQDVAVLVISVKLLMTRKVISSPRILENSIRLLGEVV